MAESLKGEAAVRLSSMRSVRFSGALMAVIPAGGTITSDPVAFDVKAGEPLAVTTYFGSLSAMRTIGLIGGKSYAAIGSR